MFRGFLIFMLLPCLRLAVLAIIFVNAFSFFCEFSSKSMSSSDTMPSPASAYCWSFPKILEAYFFSDSLFPLLCVDRMYLFWSLKLAT